MKTIKCGFTILVIIALITPNAALAGWVDDWMSNSSSVVSKYGYFAGQSRGYLSGGGYQARWAKSTDYPITITPPHLKAGCGGVDIFMGGMSFLNANYLVKKLQQILQNAPAVALDLALNVLCTQCAKAMKEFEALSDYLNHIQLDSCKASKAMVTYAADKWSHRNDEETDNDVNEQNQEDGTDDSYQSSEDATKANNDKPPIASVDNLLKGCDPEFSAIFTQLDSNGQTSLLTNVASRMGIPTETKQTLAGLIGDVGIQRRPGESMYTIYPIAPCEKSVGASANAILDGTLELRDYPPGSLCTPSTGADDNLSLYVSNVLTAVATKMENQQAITSEKAFLDTINGYAYSYLKFGVQSHTTDVVVSQLTPLVAADLTRLILKDLYLKAQVMVDKALEINANADAPPTGDPNNATPTCNVSTVSKPAIAQMNQMKENILNAQRTLNVAHDSLTAQMAYNAQIIQLLEAQSSKVESDIRKRFGIVSLSR